MERKLTCHSLPPMSSTFSSLCILHNYNRSKHTIGAALRTPTTNVSRTHSWYMQSRWMICVTVRMHLVSSRTPIETYTYTNTLLCGRCVFYILALDNHKLSFEHKHNSCIEEFLITGWYSFRLRYRVLDGRFEVSEERSASIFH